MIWQQAYNPFGNMVVSTALAADTQPASTQPAIAAMARVRVRLEVFMIISVVVVHCRIGL